jgi:hypothetical protein
MSVAPGRAGDQAPRRLLGDRFVDGSFGFSIRPFADARINRHKVYDELGGFQLAEFVHATRPWVLVVALDHTNQSLRAGEFVDALRAFWARQFEGGIETTDRAERMIAARQGAVWNGRYAELSGPWSLFEAVVRVSGREFFRISLKVPRADESTAKMLFEVVVDSFRMVRSEVTSEILEAALERGRKLLARVPSANLGEVLDAESHFLVRRGGRDVGYAHIREYEETRDGTKGVRVTERGWMFFPDDSYQYVKNDYFVSDDLKSGMFEMRLRIVTPETEGRPLAVVDQLERGIREHDKLILSYTDQLGDTSLTNDVLEVTDTYMPIALLRMLGRIAPLDEPELYAFSSYNSTRKGLVLRTYRVLGRSGSATGGSGSTAYKVEDSEGMVPPVSEIFLDDRGFVRKIVAGGDTVLRTTADQVRLLFGERVRQAKEQLAGLGLPIEE